MLISKSSFCEEHIINHAHDSKSLNQIIRLYVFSFLFSLTFFVNLKVLTGGVHKLVMEAGDILVLPARWPHIVATKGDSLAFASNFLAVTHFPLSVDSHLNASQQEVHNEEVFPRVVRIYAVLQFKIRQLQRKLNSLRGSWSPIFSSRQLTLLKEQISCELDALKMVIKVC